MDADVAYATGLVDGYRTVLTLLLGDSDDPNVAPCPQPLPPAAESWARAALVKLGSQDEAEAKARGVALDTRKAS